MSFIRGYDQETLRELVDLDECAARLAEIESQRSLPARFRMSFGQVDPALAR